MAPAATAACVLSRRNAAAASLPARAITVWRRGLQQVDYALNSSQYLVRGLDTVLGYEIRNLGEVAFGKRSNNKSKRHIGTSAWRRPPCRRAPAPLAYGSVEITPQR